MNHRASTFGSGYDDPHNDARPVLFRRAITLALMSLVAPGSAQLVMGRKWVGRIALTLYVLFLGAIAYVAWRFTQDRSAAIDLVTSETTLRLVKAGLLVVGAAWVLIILDAWRLGTPRRQGLGRGAIVLLLNVALVLGIGGGAVWASRLVGVGEDTVGSVFKAEKTVAPFEGRYNILLIGSDGAKDREGLGIRTDSMTVASVDAATGKTVLVSLPRNLENAPFPEDSPMHDLYPQGFNCGAECLLTYVHTTVAGRADAKQLYPDAEDPGLAATIDAVRGVTGLDINYYVMINMNGFSSLVNAVDGVEVDVKTRIPMFSAEQAYQVSLMSPQDQAKKYIEPGEQTLTGYQALWFARSRADSDDYTRMGRQKCLMSAMLQQLSPTTVLLNAQKIGESSKALLETDIPRKELGQFADVALKARGEKIRSVSLVPPAVNTTFPDYEQIHRLIRSAIRKSEQTATPKSPSTSRTPSSPSTTTPTTGTSEDPNAETQKANDTSDLASAC